MSTLPPPCASEKTPLDSRSESVTGTLRPGDAVIYRWFWQGDVRAVVLEVQSDGPCSGVLCDLASLDRLGQARPDRVWIARARESSFRPDPSGRFAPLRPFQCTNRHCYHHALDYPREHPQTALPCCPQCHSPIIELGPVVRLRELRGGDRFRFADRLGSVWEYRGNGWYGSPKGYDGGPWHMHENAEVVPVAGREG
jgi:hypothetical protein